MSTNPDSVEREMAFSDTEPRQAMPRRHVSIGDLSKPQSFEARYLAPFCASRGSTMSALFSPPAFSLWAVSAHLGNAAEVEWTTDHGDEALFIRSGTVTIGSQHCEESGVVIVEAGVAAVLRAEGEVELLHFGPALPTERAGGLLGTPERNGRRVHVVGAQGAYLRTRNEAPFASRVFADSCCRTCRVNFFRVMGFAPYRTVSHVHSEDEIILVLDGELHLGQNVLTPGGAVAVPGGFRYAYQAFAEYSFLNYRADMSTILTAPGSEPALESERPVGVNF